MKKYSLLILSLALCHCVFADTMIIKMKNGTEQHIDTDQIASVRFEEDQRDWREDKRPRRDETPKPHQRSPRKELSMRSDAWDSVAGNWEWRDGKAFCRSAGGTDYIGYRALYRGFEMRNGVIVAKMRVGDKGALNDVGILFRMQDSGNGYGLRIQKDGYISLRKINKGKGNHIHDVRASIVPGRDYTVRVELNDNHIMVYLDGKLVIDRNDDRFLSSGKVGIMQDRGNNGSISEISVESDD
ncbi:MAG: hypothetical protein JW942_02000 [Opitutales bacterium]|nr:hypothetical protein [Opitutales bacterium]